MKPCTLGRLRPPTGSGIGLHVKEWLGRVVVFFGFLALITARLQASQTALMDLYDCFRNPHRSDIFVSCERLSDAVRPVVLNQTLVPNNVKIVLSEHDAAYLTYVSDGVRWLLAFSGRQAILKEADYANADQLMGFDGTNYWTLNQSGPVTLHFGTSDSNTFFPPQMAFNQLTTISKREAERTSGTYQSDIILATIIGMGNEGQSVARFGFTNSFKTMLSATDNTLRAITKDGENYDIDVIGDSKTPHALVCTNKDIVTRATLEYDSNILTLSRSFHTNVASTARHRILAAHHRPEQGPHDYFSFSRYTAGMNNLIALTVTNGTTVELVPVKGAYVQGAVVDKARPTKTRSRYVVFVLFALVALPFVWMGYRRRVDNIKRTKQHST